MATTYDSPSGILAELLWWSDDHEAARPRLENAVERARERGEEYDYAALLHQLAMLEWYAGNREVAEQYCATVIRRDTGPGRAFARPLAGLGRRAVCGRPRRSGAS